ncbi:MAG: peptidylprolyl isomerase [Theionarchaea archaeon]|nr:peptidylprolyl isomerase [Theionarchaea archaeon]
MEKGDFVTINYTARVKETNKIFDTTFEDVAREEGIHMENAKYGPVTVVLGARHVIRGLEKALLDMDVGEEKEVDIEPEEAFGKRKRSLVTKVPLREFRKHDLLPRPGMQIEINNRWATVRSVSSGRVILDFNHPLSGKVVHYSVELLGTVEDTKEQIEALLTLLKIKGEVTPDEEGFSIKMEGIQKGREKNVQTLVKREVKKYIPQAEISF